MRILSLIPSATDWLVALDVGDRVVGMTHECVVPGVSAQPPSVVTPAVRHDASDPAGVDAAVTAAARDLTPLYDVDLDLVADLGPDVVVSQVLCDVCAVSAPAVAQIHQRLPGAAIITLDGVTLPGVLSDGVALAEAVGVGARGRALDDGLRARLGAVTERVAGVRRRTTAFVEWPDPIWLAGHWVPDQVVAAGGWSVTGVRAQPSVRGDLEDVSGAEVLLVGPCGYDLTEATGAAARLAGQVVAGEVWAVDADRAFSRPGPELVTGVEALAAALHPSRCPGLDHDVIQRVTAASARDPRTSTTIATGAPA